MDKVEKYSENYVNFKSISNEYSKALRLTKKNESVLETITTTEDFNSSSRVPFKHCRFRKHCFDGEHILNACFMP